jgi:hypothetical protein
MGPNGERPTQKEVAWAIVRIVLGLGQMTGAAVAMMLLVQTGVNSLSFGAVILTCMLTTTSVLLFGRRK